MREGVEKDINLGFFGGLKTYPQAAAWSIILSSSIIMEGYDTCLLGAFFAFPPFQEDFGSQLPSGDYQVPAVWQAGLANGAQLSNIMPSEGITLMILRLGACWVSLSTASCAT